MNRDKILKAEQFHAISSGSDFGENIRGEIERSTPQKFQLYQTQIIISSYITKFGCLFKLKEIANLI